MKRFKYYHLLILSFAFVLFDYLNFQISESWFIYDVFLRLILWIIIFFLYLIGLLKYLKYEEISLRNISLPLIILITIYILYFTKTFQEKPILFAYYDGDINGISIELFENNTYKIHDNSIFGGDVFSGEFILKKDSLILSNEFPLGKERGFSNKIVKFGDTLKWKTNKNNFEFNLRIIKKEENEYIRNWLTH